MRFVIVVILIVSIGALGFQLYRLYREKKSFEEELAKVNSQTGPLLSENEELVEEINYFSDPDNLEKELRSQFNYAKPGEKLIIVVPKE